MRSASPNSWTAIMTLRTNGERGDQCNFIADPVKHSFGGAWMALCRSRR
jgi:hypothetical protein